MATQIATILGREFDAMRIVIDGRSVSERDLIAAVGEKLWPMAAMALRDTACPDDWGAAGLSVPVYPALASLAAAVLRHAPEIDALERGAPTTDNADNILAGMLELARASGEPVMLALGTLLLLRLPEKHKILRAIAHCADPGGPTKILGQSIEFARRRLRAAQSTPSEAARQAETMLSLLTLQDSDGAGADQRRQSVRLRAQLASACQNGMRDGLRSHVTDTLASLGGVGVNEMHAAETLDAIEQAVRDIRRLDSVARTCGDPDPCAALLRETAVQVMTTASGRTLDRADRARLVELLLGPEAGISAYQGADLP